MASKKFYAIQKGKKTGIFTSWDETKSYVSGYPGAIYKGFLTLEEAQNWLTGTPNNKLPKNKINNDRSKAILLYTDGGSRNTGNVAGGHVKKDDLAAWAYLIKKDGQKWSDSAGEFGATNNRMEIMALIKGLKTIKAQFGVKAPILVVADSKYVLDAIQKRWLDSWYRKSWRKADGQVVANATLWAEVYQLLPEFSDVSFTWTKGHADNDGNVFVDELLNKTMDKMKNGTKTDLNNVNKKMKSANLTTNKKVVTSNAKKMDVTTKKSVADLKETFAQLGLFDETKD